MSKTFTIRLNDQLHDQAVKHAESSNSNLADLIRSALSEKMNGVTLADVCARIAEQSAKLDKIIALAEAEEVEGGAA